MRTCWAKCLGDCSDKISGEHVITKGVFLTDSVKVSDCHGVLMISKTSDFELVAGIALDNSRLSEADDMRSEFRKSICDSASLSDARKILQPQRWK